MWQAGSFTFFNVESSSDFKICYLCTVLVGVGEMKGSHEIHDLSIECQPLLKIMPCRDGTSVHMYSESISRKLDSTKQMRWKQLLILRTRYSD